MHLTCNYKCINNVLNIKHKTLNTIIWNDWKHEKYGGGGNRNVKLKPPIGDSKSLLQFFSIVYTHFLKACLIFSELYTQIQKNTHNGQNPSILLQNETLHSKQCYFFSKWDFVFKWHTQTIICIDIYKNQLNTDVLNVKHYDECKTLLLHSS